MRPTQYASLLLLSTMLSTSVPAQNTRISDSNRIGWYNYFGTFKLSNALSVHTEYQWRRENFIADGQQNLLRTGINYRLNPKLTVRAGYAWVETFPYGNVPINALGKDFTEHRLYQMVTLSDRIAVVDLSHRFMLEQRWLGRYSSADLSREDDYVYVNRLRYMVRVQAALNGKPMADQTPYAALYDEVFVGFGKNVGENVFDQNRLGLLLGYRFNGNFSLEGGYLSQIVQLGREVDNRNVFQYNHGFIINALLTVDLFKKPALP
jgi:hypothetical protein